MSKIDEDLISKTRMTALGEVAAGIAHEINNPLAILKQCIHLIEDYIKRDQVAEVQRNRLVEKAVLTIDRVAALTKALLIFSREENREPLVKTSLRRIVGEAIDRQTSTLKTLGITLDTSGVPLDLEVKCREQQLVEVLSCLLANALESVAEVQNPAVAVTARETSKGQEITVRDNGGGIKPAIASKVFDPFFSTKAIGHVGLGLSIVKELVRAHGGSITFESEPGKTEFVVGLTTRSDR